MHNITSTANSLIKELVALKKTAKRKKKDLIIVDGEREIGAAIETGWQIEGLFICEKILEKRGQNPRLFGVSENKMISVTEDIFLKISFKEKPDGFVATFKSKELVLTLADTISKNVTNFLKPSLRWAKSKLL